MLRHTLGLRRVASHIADSMQHEMEPSNGLTAVGLYLPRYDRKVG